MPLYTYHCMAGHEQRAFRKVDARDQCPPCDHCQCETFRLFEAPAVRADIQPYQSPVDGRWINSRRERIEDLKRNNSIEWEPGIRQDLPRLKAAADERAFAPMAATIEKTARELVAAGKIDPL